MGRESRLLGATGGVSIPALQNLPTPTPRMRGVGPPHEGEVWSGTVVLAPNDLACFLPFGRRERHEQLRELLGLAQGRRVIAGKCLRAQAGRDLAGIDQVDLHAAVGGLARI